MKQISFPPLAPMPAVGETISVELPNASPPRHNPIFKNQPESYIYTGKVLPPFAWLSKTEFCLSSDDPNIPIRVIDIDYVCKIEGSKSKTPSRSVKEEPKTKVHHVIGSKGNTYVVTVTGNKATCTCPQYQFRHQECRHIKQVLESGG